MLLFAVSVENEKKKGKKKKEASRKLFLVNYNPSGCKRLLELHRDSCSMRFQTLNMVIKKRIMDHSSKNSFILKSYQWKYLVTLIF